MTISKIVPIFPFIAFAIAFAAYSTANSQASRPTIDPRGLGTVEEYITGSPDSKLRSVYIASLGIDVMNGQVTLNDGRSVAGVRIISVLPHDVGAAAGLRGENVVIPVQLLTGVLVAGAVVFPPAVLGAVLVERSGIGESYDLIIAADGQRTHDVRELAEALRETLRGELVYLVIVRQGQRESVVVRLE
jgi:S1-C subfamily serine protease